MRKIEYIELGGTLFVPSTYKDLLSIAEDKKYPNLKSVLIDTEDGIAQRDLKSALENIKELLLELKKSSVLLFLRPRNTEVLKELLALEGIQKIDGFILPKFSLSNAQEYLDAVGKKYLIMPSIEGEELFNQTKLFALRELLLPYQEQIITIRFGLEDMLRELSMKRKCDESVFDFSATASVLGNFIATFKSAGFNVSGGVYPCFRDTEGFKKDVLRDLKEGLFSKTIIHPNQIDTVNELYKVTQEEFDDAKEIYESTEAVFNQNSKMAEVSTMRPSALRIIKRAEIYGVKKS